ncbi:unnamed protein product [Effrenium voratum]|uniref:Uncharacterized protein n=1 Tax=Effrenium voratum TaxID=2562239 RepID=A0AA36JAE9_9DINO|nr:unnamed protein product [Effrenium voratum]
MDPGEMRLQDAIEATKALYLRDLPAHVCVGPMPVGGFTLPELPLRDLDAGAPSIKHFVDVVMDIPAGDMNIENIKAIFRDQADELPAVMKPKSRPIFDTATQYILLPQTDGNICLLKHTYVVDEKVTGQYVIKMLQGKGYEISWGTGNKKCARLVQKALDSLANDTTTAKLCRRYDLTVKDFEPEVRQVLEIVPHLRDQSLWLLGEPGKGDGEFRTTSDLDFFKGVPFTKRTPALYDDGSIGNEETMTRARWTNAKFVRNQLRIVLDNSYNPDAEPGDNLNDEDLVVSHTAFFSMIRPALGIMANTDAMAVMKRSVVVIFGKNHITFRLPSGQEIEANRIRRNKVDIIRGSSKGILNLRLMQKSSPMRNGKYVVLNVHENHFFAVQHVDGFVSEDEEYAHCAYSLRGGAKAHDVKAIVYGMTGGIDVQVRTMRCTSYSCRRTFGPNFFVDAGSKINTATPEDIDEVLFLSNKMGFTVDYLK